MMSGMDPEARATSVAWPTPILGLVLLFVGALAINITLHSRLGALMLLKPKFQIMFSCVITVLALMITWLILADSSPLHEYFLWHVTIPNLWRLTMLIPYIFGAIIAGNPHAPSEAILYIAVIIQWFLIGFLLSIPFAKFLVKWRKM